jgi:uncharacterized protein
MSTHGPAEQLFQLQETDTGIEQAGKAVSQLKQQIIDNTTLARARQLVAKAEQQEAELKSKQRQLEMNDADLTTKIKAATEQLYGGKVGNPKELANLQHESEILKTKLNGVEDSALEVMDQLEKAGAALTKTRADLVRVEAAEGQRQQALRAELKAQQERLVTLTAARAALAGAIEPALVSRYDRLRAGKGVAVAAVERGICQGCRIGLFAAPLQQLRAGKLLNCDNCGRFLHLA